MVQRNQRCDEEKLILSTPERCVQEVPGVAATRAGWTRSAESGEAVGVSSVA